MEVLRDLAREDSRVSYQRHGSRLGIAGNYSFGMQHVETPYFSLLGDDDVLLPDFYQKALEGFGKFPEAAFSALATIVMHPRDRVAVLGMREWQDGLHQPPEGLRKMLQLWPPQLIGVVFRRELIEQLGPLDAEVGNAMDLDYEYRVAAHFPYVASREPGAVWVGHSESATVQGSLEGFWPGWLKMIRNLTQDDKIPAEVRDLAAQVLTRRIKDLLYIDSGMRAVMANRCEEAQKSAEILAKEFREEKKAARLRRLVRVQLAFTPFGRLVAWALAGRQKLWKVWDAEYRKQGMCYLAYAKYLDVS